MKNSEELEAIEVAIRMKWNLDFSYNELKQWSYDLVYYLYSLKDSRGSIIEGYTHDGRVLAVSQWHKGNPILLRNLRELVFKYHREQTTDYHFSPIIPWSNLESEI